MSTTLLAVGFLTFLMLGLAVASAREHLKEQVRNNRPRLIIEGGYRIRRKESAK